MGRREDSEKDQEGRGWVPDVMWRRDGDGRRNEGASESDEENELRRCAGEERSCDNLPRFRQSAPY